MKYLVTFDTVTEQSAEDGEASASGFVDSAGFTADALSPEVADMGWTLSEVLDRVQSSADHCEAQERSIYCYPGSGFWLDSWLSNLPTHEDDGEIIGATFAIHRPDGMSDGSWRRVCRLLGAKLYF